MGLFESFGWSFPFFDGNKNSGCFTFVIKDILKMHENLNIG